MPLFDITAMAVNPDTGDKLADPRTERIDTAENELFEGCTTPWEVEDRFLGYWNRLNDHWEYEYPQGKEKLCVLSVTPVAA
jgi:hypothetical protein